MTKKGNISFFKILLKKPEIRQEYMCLFQLSYITLGLSDGNASFLLEQLSLSECEVLLIGPNLALSDWQKKVQADLCSEVSCRSVEVNQEEFIKRTGTTNIQ